MASVSSVIKFSATQEARPLLIHKSNMRVSACSMKRFASATVGCTLDDFVVAAKCFFMGVCARATEVVRINDNTSRPNWRPNKECWKDLVDVMKFSCGSVTGNQFQIRAPRNSRNAGGTPA